MTETTAEDIQRYIDDNFLTLDTVARRAHVTPERVLDLVAAHCIPRHSYAVRRAVAFTSTFGEYPTPAPPLRYYHPDMVGWIEKVEALAGDHSLSEVARIMRGAFERAVEQALYGEPAPWPRGVDDAWADWMDGTYGLCLKSLTVAALVQKALSRAAIAAIVRPEPDHCLTDDERAGLEMAIARYDQVTSSFAPHEIDRSSRRLEFGAAIEKYGLPL